MKKIFIFTIFVIPFFSCMAQPAPEKIPILYGSFAKEELEAAPFDKWFTTGKDSYQPDISIINAIKKLNNKDISVRIFLGTWCGDSKRELPRFMKIMDALAIPAGSIQLIGLGRDSLMKQSPNHEEEGQGIFRVPVFIVYRNGVEVNRINEYPAVSLEKDLLAILSKENYQPNYKSFATVKSWLQNGTLLDKNSSIRGLAMQVRALVAGENELNSLAYLLLGQGKKEEALKLFQVNAQIYPESANILSSLGEGYYKTGDSKMAVQFLERSLEINKDPQLVKSILTVLYAAKGIKE